MSAVRPADNPFSSRKMEALPYVGGPASSRDGAGAQDGVLVRNRQNQGVGLGDSG